jgi:diguanylate cyclase (GGDEF)-like protein
LESKKILIVDDELSLIEVVKDVLEEGDFRVVSANDTVSGFQKAIDSHPDLILLDVKLGTASGYELCKRIKDNPKLRFTPVIMLTGRDLLKDELEGFKAGADDYITKPFKPNLLIARIVSAIERSARDLDANALTRLPGNRRIMDEIQKRIDGKGVFSVLHLDLNDFKAFNDRYGFVRGDEAIKLTGDILDKCFSEFKARATFLGHVGGDDFVGVVDSHEVVPLCEKIISTFDAAIPRLYDEEDRQKKRIMAVDRKGNKVELPVMGLAIAVVTNKNKQFRHPGEVSFIAGDLKKWAKTHEGSNFVIDRRV